DSKDLFEICKTVKADYLARYGYVDEWKCKYFVKRGDIFGIKIKINSSRGIPRKFIHILVDNTGKLSSQQKGFFKMSDCILLNGNISLFKQQMKSKCNGVDYYKVTDSKDLFEICKTVKADYLARYGYVDEWKCKYFVKRGDIFGIKIKINSSRGIPRKFIHILVDNTGKLISQQKGFFKMSDCILLNEYWEHYGNLLGGTRYSQLDEINAGNVGNLTIAWTFRYGPSPWGYAADRLFLKDQQAPIMVDDGSKHGNDLLILCTPW
ncbi:unnamed protein product, partial [Owenia fusiformis]